MTDRQYRQYHIAMIVTECICAIALAAGLFVAASKGTANVAATTWEYRQ